MRMFVLAIAALAIPSPAFAATCGYWVPQTNGTSWRVCVDAQAGVRFCELKWAGSIKRITCP